LTLVMFADIKSHWY